MSPPYCPIGGASVMVEKNGMCPCLKQHRRTLRDHMKLSFALVKKGFSAGIGSEGTGLIFSSLGRGAFCVLTAKSL